MPSNSTFYKNITIVRRLQLAGMVIIVLIGSILGVGWVNYKAASDGYNVALGVQASAAHLQLMLRGLNESAFTQGASASVKATREGIKRFDEEQQSLINIAQENRDVRKFLTGEWFARWKDIKERVEAFLAQSESVDFSNVKQMVEIGKLVNHAGKIADEFATFAQETREQADQAQASALSSMATTIGAALLIAAIMFWSLLNSIKKPVQHLRAFIIKVEQTSNLSERVSLDYQDEIGEMGSAFNRMLDKFQGILQNVVRVIDQLTGETRHLHRVSESTSSGVAEQKAATEELASAMSHMTSAVQEVSHSILKSADGISIVKCETDNSRQVVKDSVQSIDALATNVREAGDVIKQLNTKAANIGRVLDVIKEIADQTNLLALNAAIEAARAGEHGRGFAVVADEVRSLATRTQSSTTDIQTMISQLQADANKAVTVMDQGRERAQTSVDESTRAMESLVTMTKTVTSIADMSTQIAAAVEEQSAVADRINANMVGINHIAETTANGANETAQISGTIGDLAKALGSTINQFKIH